MGFSRVAWVAKLTEESDDDRGTSAPDFGDESKSLGGDGAGRALMKRTIILDDSTLADEDVPPPRINGRRHPRTAVPGCAEARGPSAVPDGGTAGTERAMTEIARASGVLATRSGASGTSGAAVGKCPMPALIDVTIPVRVVFDTDAKSLPNSLTALVSSLDYDLSRSVGIFRSIFVNFCDEFCRS